jgi:hypothetical protein
MKILAIERDLKAMPSGAREDLLKREAAVAWRLRQEDVLREIYMAEGRTKAILILECASLDEARRRLATLPLVAEGCTDFALYELEPYPGYARLFSQAQ